MAGLTTHILDLASGFPASDVRIDVCRIEHGLASCLKSVTTNSDGRCDEDLIAEKEMTPGLYELVFHIGEYFDRRGLDLPQPKFIDQVPIRFGVAETDKHYHVPLLVSPFGYSTYRGS